MKKFKIGLQLYSIRDEMEKSVDDALRQVKEMGYDCVEFAGYFGHTAEEIKGMLDKYGLECISVHQGPELFRDEGQKAVDFIKILGAKYAAVPWYGKELHAGTEHWEETVKLFNSNGKLLKDNGIQQLYHNHDFEFEKFDGKFLLDWIYETIPQEYMQPEVDTCWVHYAGYDPAEYLLQYSGRIEVVHLKDFECKKLANGPAYALIDNEGKEIETDREDNGFRFRPVGFGRQNIPAIIDAAEKAGATCFIVEQDEWYDGSSVADAKASREYLKSLGL
jgi:sugar phosphate isomerase/epimerase